MRRLFTAACCTQLRSARSTCMLGLRHTALPTERTVALQARVSNKPWLSDLGNAGCSEDVLVDRAVSSRAAHNIALQRMIPLAACTARCIALACAAALVSGPFALSACPARSTSPSTPSHKSGNVDTNSPGRLSQHRSQALTGRKGQHLQCRKCKLRFVDSAAQGQLSRAPGLTLTRSFF